MSERCYEFECRFTFTDEQQRKQTLCGVAGIVLNRTQITHRHPTDTPDDSPNLAVDELFMTATRLLLTGKFVNEKNFTGLASHNLRHLADLMDNDPDFKVKTATENGRKYILFDIPDKEHK